MAKQDVIAFKIQAILNGTLNRSDLEKILRDNDVGGLIHTPSGETCKHYGGIVTWHTPFAPNPLIFTNPEFFPEVAEILWFRDKIESYRHSSFPVPSDGIGPYRFKSVEDYWRFVNEAKGYGLIRLIGSREVAPNKFEEYREEICLGLNPKVVLLTRYMPTFMGLPNPEIERAIKEGRQIFFKNEEDLREDNRIDHYANRNFERELHKKSEKRYCPLPIPQGLHKDVSSGFDRAHFIENDGRFMFFGDSPNYVRGDVKDERLAEIVDKLTFEANHFRGVRVAPVLQREGSVLYYARVGEYPNVVDLYKFMKSKTPELDGIVEDMFRQALRISAELSIVADIALSDKEKEYIKHVYGYSNPTLDVIRRFGIQEPEFIDGYQRTIGLMKAELMKKFGRICTDRHSANFVLDGVREDSNGIPEFTSKKRPRVWAVDPDNLQFDLLQRDKSKLIYVPQNGFTLQQIKGFSDFYFEAHGIPADWKEDYEIGSVVADFERHHSWALKLLDKKMKRAKNYQEALDVAKEAQYHYDIGCMASDGIKAFLSPFDSNADGDLRIINKYLENNFNAMVAKSLDERVNKGVIDTNHVLGVYSVLNAKFVRSCLAQ